MINQNDTAHTLPIYSLPFYILHARTSSYTHNNHDDEANHASSS